MKFGCFWFEYDSFWQVFNYFSLIIVPLGLIGNLLMFTIYSQPSLSKLPVSINYRVISIVNIYITLNWIRIFSIFQYNFYWGNRSTFWCKIVTFSVYTAGPISVWCMVAASVDNFISIVYPKRFAFTRHRSYALLVVSFIIIYNILFYAQMLVSFDLRAVNSSSGNMSALVCYSPLENMTNIMDLINTSLVPFTIMITFSILTFVGVLKSRARMLKSSSAAQTGTVVFSRSHSRDIKFGVTLITLNIIFVVFNSPNSFYSSILLKNEIIEINNLQRVLAYLVLLLYYMFYSLMFYVKTAINTIVRNEVRKICYQAFRLSNLSQNFRSEQYT